MPSNVTRALDRSINLHHYPTSPLPMSLPLKIGWLIWVCPIISPPISIIWPFILIGHITGLPITGMGLKTLSKPPNCHKLKVFGRLLSIVSSLHPPLFGGYLPTQSALHCLDILLNVFFIEDRFPFQSHDSSISRVFSSD